MLLVGSEKLIMQIAEPFEYGLDTNNPNFLEANIIHEFELGDRQYWVVDCKFVFKDITYNTGIVRTGYFSDKLMTYTLNLQKYMSCKMSFITPRHPDEMKLLSGDKESYEYFMSRRNLTSMGKSIGLTSGEAYGLRGHKN
jgi:hypothetical protein